MSALGKKSDEEVAYMLEYNEEKTQMRLTLFSGRPVDAKEFLQALSVYIEDFNENPEQIYYYGSDLVDDRH